MKSQPLSSKEWGQRIILALLFIIIGCAVMIVFKPWGKSFIADPVANYLWRIAASLVLGVVALLLHRVARLEKYWQVFFALFVLSVALSLDWVFANYLFDSLWGSVLFHAGMDIPIFLGIFSGL